jgi:hypothetical protein
MKEFFDIKELKQQHVEENELKNVTIFTYLNDIMINKKGDVHIKNDPSMSKFNTYQILRFLSLDEGYVSFINVINGFQDILTKEETYKLLIKTIPRSKRFLIFPKKTEEYIDEESLNILSRYFICSKYQSEEFIKLNLISSLDIEKIKNMYGGRDDRKN